ncbi:Semaphorin-4G [Liparis tanakae]|uniref:Semaphorin-4G n=1 Tax=Liparis tanakae TaxID=230148 RepID=A0A4Z2GDW9_9TELE|nr:Semaphorin-4G [Liparis tanakae]
MRRSAEMQGSSAARLLLLSCCVCAAAGYPFRTPLDLDVTPRVTVLNSGLQGCRRFQSSAVSSSTMLLEADSERLLVGARGAVFALNASDISASSALTVSVCLCLCLCCFVSCTSAALSLTLPQLHLHNAGTF